MAGKSLILGVVALVCAAPAAAHAETLVNNNGPSIAIADRAHGSSAPGLGSPYPSVLKVEGGDGAIEDVNVQVTLSHEFPDDLDLVLVSPQHGPEVLMSDVCLGTEFNNQVFNFNQQATNFLPDDSQLPGGMGCTHGGSWKPTDAEDDGAPPDSWPSPGPGNVSHSNLDDLDGETPNGDWKLYAVDDTEGSVGSIVNWGLTITTDTSEIIVPAGPSTAGVSNPYPSAKSFDTPPGRVTSDVDLHVVGFHHQHPDDVDMLLQAPTGQSTLVMSDACGGDDILSGLSWLFSDEADSQMSDTSLAGCTNTSYRPSDFPTTSDDFPAPAPAPPYALTLDALDGLQGGEWKLFVDDDAGGDTGYIEGWNLVMTTRPAAALGFANPTSSAIEGQTAGLTVARQGPGILGPATVDVTINHNGTDPTDIGPVQTQLQFARGEGAKTLAIPIVADNEGEGAEEFTVSLSDPVNDALLSDATSTATVTIAPSEAVTRPEDVDNRFTVDSVERHRNGSGQLEVTVPGAGTLAVDDAGAKLKAGTTDLLKAAQIDVAEAGTAVVPLKPAQQAKRKLRRGKKVKLSAAITYTPTGGVANTAEAPITLKRKRG